MGENTFRVISGRARRRIGGFGVAVMAFVGQFADADGAFATAGSVGIPISVGSGPADVELTPDGSKAYVTNFVGDTVSVIDTATSSVTTITLAAGAGPNGVESSPSGATMYTANDNGTVSVIDTATDTVATTITVGGHLRGVALTPDGSALYLTDFGGATVYKVATATNTVTATITVGNNPYDVVVTPDGAHVYVGNFGPNSVSVIATATDAVLVTIPVGTSPRSLAVTPDGSRVYVDNRDSNNVSVIATATNLVTATIPVGTLPRGLAVAPDGSAVYVDNSGNGSMSVISTATNAVTDTLPIAGPGSEIEYLTLPADGSTAYVVDTTDNQVLPVSFFPSGLAAVPGNGAATLTWDPLPGAISYSVFSATVSGIEFTGDPPACTSTTTSCSALGLTNGVTYYFKVVANFTGGAVSPFSDEASATPTAAAPPPPGSGTGQAAPPSPTIAVTSSANPSAPGTSPTFTATLSPAPGCGTVSWLIDNAAPAAGVTSGGSGGSFTLGPVTGLPNGYHPVTAVFSGCASAGSASGTAIQVVEQTPAPPNTAGPSITADLTSAHPSKDGWYRTPVHVSFVCAPGSAALTTPCPDPFTFRHNGRNQSVTRTITASDGGSASVTTPPINLDRQAPTLAVTGAMTGAVYRRGKHLTCAAADALSGVESCMILKHRHPLGESTVVSWRAVATDVAGNSVTENGHYVVSG